MKAKTKVALKALWLFFVDLLLVLGVIMFLFWLVSATGCKTREMSKQSNTQKIDSSGTKKSQSATTDKSTSTTSVLKQDTATKKKETEWETEITIEDSRVPITVKEGDFIIGKVADSIWKAGHGGKITIKTKGKAVKTETKGSDSLAHSTTQKDINTNSKSEEKAAVEKKGTEKNKAVKVTKTGTGLYWVGGIAVVVALILFWFFGRPKGAK